MNWLRNIFNKLSQGLRRMMAGRYGMDKLSSVLLWTSLAVSVLGLLLPFPVARLVLTGIAYVLMFLAILRSFSRQTYKRYQENRQFLLLLDRLKDREHRYFQCPRCHQPVRVPRGKGKISITCPKCKEKFIKKT